MKIIFIKKENNLFYMEIFNKVNKFNYNKIETIDLRSINKFEIDEENKNKFIISYNNKELSIELHPQVTNSFFETYKNFEKEMNKNDF